MKANSNLTNNSRRHFIKQAGLISIGFIALSRCTDAKAEITSENKMMDIGLQRDPLGYLDLPKGFSYKIISRAGEPMEDGFLLPGRPDGMGAFKLDHQRLIIIRNHELSAQSPRLGPFGESNKLLTSFDSSLFYDAGSGHYPSLGGTTTLIYNEGTQEVEQQFLSLVGTNRNCAGGVTPWGTWLTCEEDVSSKHGPIEKDHGYVFEVPAHSSPQVIQPKPIKAMGRFNHEAVCVDPNTGIVYQTEDRSNGLIYRYLPHVKEQLLKGGRLQALAIIDQPKLDTRNWKKRKIKLNKPMEVRWVDLDKIDSSQDNLRLIGAGNGAAVFARGEGMWFGNNEIYFACTNGGTKKNGQVFRYVPSPYEGTEKELKVPGRLELFAETRNTNLLSMCDNLTVAPWGDVILCEDNSRCNYIRGIRPNGKIYTFACNRSSSSEFVGAVFSPSGKTLFVNIQENGETLAITGPWENLA